ncbi:MAG: hypothetical protein Q8O87_03475 [bacterium]|nr:hypothetical protein [bacterium]
MFNRIENFGERWYGVTVLLALLFILAFAPLLLGGQLVFDDDLLGTFYPYYHFYSQSIDSGDSFLWNPNSSSGYPPFVGIVNSLLSPVTYLLSVLLPPLANYHWTLWFYIVLAIFFCDLFLRDVGIKFWGRLIGALVFVSGPIFLNLDISTIAPMYALPLMLFCLWRIKHSQRLWAYVILGGIGLTVSWLASFQGFLLQVFIFAGAFVLVLGWKDRVVLRRLIAALILIVLIAAALSSFYLYWGSTLASLSERAGGLSYEQSAVKATTLWDLSRFWLPSFKVNYFAISQATLYLGFLPLFFFVLAFFKRQTNRLYYFFLLAYAVAFLISIKYSPLFWILQKLPILNLFKVPSRWMFTSSFAAAFLIATNVNIIFDSTEKIGKKIYSWFARVNCTIAAIIAVASSLFIFGYDRILAFLKSLFLANFYAGTSQAIPLDSYYRLIETWLGNFRRVFDLSVATVFWPFIFMVLGLALLWIFYSKQILDNKSFIRWAGVLTVFNFLFVLYSFYPTFSQKIVEDKSPTIEFLQQHPGKFLSFLPNRPHHEYAVSPHDLTIETQVAPWLLGLNSDIHLLYGLDGAGNSDSLLNRRMGRLLAAVGEGSILGESEEVNLIDQLVTPEEKIKTLESRRNLLDWLGIRYIITAYELGEPFKKVLTTRNQLPYDYEVFIYENPSYHSSAYLSENVEIMKQDEHISFRRMFNAASADVDILECITEACLGLANGSLADNDGVHIVERHNDSIILTAETDRSRLLVLLQNNLPGWLATIDGQPAEILMVNGTFIATIVPTGDHKIEFKYKPWKI